jgi:hypothetical protein
MAALILLFAFDEAHYRQDSTLLPQCVKLTCFLQSLLGESFFQTLEDCANSKNEMKDLFHDGLVFFNHFVRLIQQPTAQTVMDAFQRGAALFAPYNFPGCDLIILVFVRSAVWSSIRIDKVDKVRS